LTSVAVVFRLIYWGSYFSFRRLDRKYKWILCFGRSSAHIKFW